MVRMKLEELDSVRQLDFDIPNRQLTIYHEGEVNKIERLIHELHLDATLLKNESAEVVTAPAQVADEKKLLWIVLVINFSFFLIEASSGIISKSMGLVADSLDMLADALVYGLSLYAVGRHRNSRKKVARISGYFQLILAVAGFVEVVRRFSGYDTPPAFETMITVSILALIANAICLYVLQRSKSQEVHLKASMIFTSNDIVINLGVTLAGALVYLTSSNKPDLIIGIIVFFIVTRGALRILSLSK